LAEILDRNHTVEIAGIDTERGIWQPLEGEWDYTIFSTHPSVKKFPRQAKSMANELSGDVVIACKPRTTSYGLGLINKYINDVPVILDIDDWDTGILRNKTSSFKYCMDNLIKWKNLNRGYYVQILEQLSFLSDGLTVSNSFLNERYGGTIIPHVRNTNEFSPELFEMNAARNDLELDCGPTIVMFSGTPRHHKGVDKLISAINKIDDEEVVGVIVGADNSEYRAVLNH